MFYNNIFIKILYMCITSLHLFKKHICKKIFACMYIFSTKNNLVLTKKDQISRISKAEWKFDNSVMIFDKKYSFTSFYIGNLLCLSV